jgi:hypothetical protein
VEEIASLRDLLRPGESALAVLTDGRRLRLSGDGTGTSGNWVIDPARQVDRFIVYYREGTAGETAKLYIADYAGAAPSPEAGRFVVSFEGAQQVGVTRWPWPEFADTGAKAGQRITSRSGSSPRTQLRCCPRSPVPE